MPEPATHSRSVRRWLRFRLRTVLALTTLLCVLLAWIASERRQSAREMEIAETLRTRGCFVEVGGPCDWCDVTTRPLLHPQTWWQRGAQRILGPRIYAVEISDKSLITDLTPLPDLMNLKVLFIEAKKVRDLRPLTQLTQLELVVVCNASVRDLAPVTRLRKVRVLGLELVEADDLRPLTELTQLTHVSIDCKNIRDLTPLAALQNLKWLEIAGRSLTEAEMHQLRTALPGCQIIQD